MSRRRKLEKFADLKRFDHVFEMTTPGSPLVIQNLNTNIIIKGKWSEYAFQNHNPICVELACGRGEYSIGLARKNASINYIGVDIKGARIWQGATIVKNEKLENVAFLRIRIEQLEYFFKHGEIDHIWITFPDPFPSKENRRLTCSFMLNKYHPLLKKGGKVHFKTDDPDLFDFSLKVAEKSKLFEMNYHCHDIYAGPLYSDDLELKTYYERQHLKDGKDIKYMKLTRQ